jgi:superfamily II DNA/RNA helicase
VPVVLDGLASETPELKLAELLKQYRASREELLKGAGNKQRAAELLVVTNLQKRLLSSVEAFRRTLGVHSDTLKRREQGQVLRTASRPDQLGLLQQAIDGDDDRADAEEESVLAEADQEHRLAVATAALAVGPSEWDLLKKMAEISHKASHQADARIDFLRHWIRRHLCPDLGQPGAQWNGERLLIFTEYADTKRWLEEQLRGLIAGSDHEEKRIATFHGGIGDEKREALKRSFNSPPELDPLRILIATDAAREGVNLQNHCRYLFHFDVPWNPGRMEQRNGRIDRTLQRSPEVYCHYFVLPQRPEDRVLDVLVKKTEEIRSALGSLPPVVVGKLNELLAKGINPTAIAAMIETIDAVDKDEGFKRTQALMSVELEDSRERTEELKTQISRLEKALQKSEDWLHFSSELFRDALNTSLRVSTREGDAIPQLMPKDPAGAAVDPERAEWIFPSAKQLPGGEHSWGDVLDALRPPRQPGQKLWDWRRDTTPQPVVFKDPQEVNADRVHLHLEHPLVQRLLNRFLVRGFQTDELSRAAVISTADDTAKLILLARLSLYGHGAARLHDEVIELVAEWDPADPARRLRVLNATKTDMALADLKASLQQRLPSASSAAQQQLRLGLPADVAQLKERLEALADQRATKAQQLLEQRAEVEAAAFVKVLQEQRERILKTRSKYDNEADQLAFSFAADEQAQLRQLRDNRNHWEKRLARIDRELEVEPVAIRRTFEVSTAPRIEPAGAIYLWPLEATP